MPVREKEQSGAELRRARRFLTSRCTRRAPRNRGVLRVEAGGSLLRQTRCWRKADSNSWSPFSARATLSLFATSRFEWDLCATYRSEPILPPIPSECAWSVVVVTVLRARVGVWQGTPSQASLELDEAALVECDPTSCPVLKAADVRRAASEAAPDPFETIA